MLRLTSAYDAPAKIVRNALHPQAHAKDWRLLPKLHNDFAAYSEIFLISGITWSRRDYDAVVCSVLYLIERDLIVAYYIERKDSSRRKNLPHILIEVVCKGIVVVEN